jgi:hypothetical protein
MTTEPNQSTALQLARQAGMELAATSAASLAKATIEAKFTIALRNNRTVMACRDRILEACKRPGFARAALYSKPVGAGKVEGFSIRFTEMGMQAWGNVDVSAPIVFEDETKRMIRVSVTDLETNTSYSEDNHHG